jgi:hypothetical protein
MKGLEAPEPDGSAAGKLPFGKKFPDQPSDTDAAATVPFVLTKLASISNVEKVMLGSSPTVRSRSVGGEAAGVYFVWPTVKLAVPASPELEEYW